MTLPNSLIAIAIVFFCTAADIIAGIYSLTLFLSNYPSTWLAYFLIFNSFLGITLSYSLSFFLKTHVKRNSLVVLILSILIFGLFTVLIQFHFYWLPFLISSFTGVIAEICVRMIISVIPLGFSLLAYKKIAQHIQKIIAASVAIGGFSIPLLLTYLPLDFLLITVIICLLGSCLSLHSFSFLPTSDEKKTLSSSLSLLKTPLTRQITLFFIFSLIAWTFIDYTFKFELAQNYTGKALADFQGYYRSFIDIIGIIVAFSFAKYLTNSFYMRRLLYLTQALTLVGCLLFIFSPTFWAISLLFAIRFIFYYNYVSVSLRIFLNILPSIDRATVKFKIGTVILNTTSLLSSLFLLIPSAGYLNAKGLIVISFFLTIPTFYFIKLIVQEYNNTLGREVEFNRFKSHLLEPLSTINVSTSLVIDPNLSEISTHEEEVANLEIFVPKYLNQLNHSEITTAKNIFYHLGSKAIPFILAAIPDSKNRSLLFSLLAMIPGEEAENALSELLENEEIVGRSTIAREMNLRACFQGVGRSFKALAKRLVFQEIEYSHYLNALLLRYPHQEIKSEIQLRLNLAKLRCLYWVAIATDPTQINRIIPTLIKEGNETRIEKEKAFELLETLTRDPFINSKLLELFGLEQKKKSEKTPIKYFNDSWLDRVIQSVTNPKEGIEMDLLNRVLQLRKFELFKNLSAEALAAVAKETKEEFLSRGDTIFCEGTSPDAVYFICSGQVKFVREEETLSVLGENEFFGELGLIDGEPRTASAIAITDCIVLVLEKSTFDRITEDLPEVLRSIAQVILRYLRKNLLNYFRS